MTADVSCPSCGAGWWVTNPAAFPFTACPDCTPTPDRSAPAGEADDALLSGPSVAELTEGAKAAAVLVACFVGGLVGVGFLGLWLRDLVGRSL